MPNIVLTAILRANISQFLSGLVNASNGLKQFSASAKNLTKIFDVLVLNEFLRVLKQVKDTVAGIITDLLETSARWEQMEIGMAAVVLSSNKISDATGKQLNYADQFNRSLILSKNLMREMRIDAALNVGTTEELASTFVGLTNSVSNTSKAGDDSIQKTRKLANALVSTSYILGPMVLKGGIDQAVRETNELLQGRVTLLNTFARALGIASGAGREAFKEAHKAGQGYDFLMDRMKAFSAAQNALSLSYEGLTSTLKDMFDLTKQTIAEFGFERVSKSIKDIVDLMVKRLPDGTAKISEGFLKFLGELAPLFDELMIPLMELSKTIIQGVIDNKDVIISFLRLSISLLSIQVELLNLTLTALRPVLNVILHILAVAMDGLTALLSLIRWVINGIQSIANWIGNVLHPIIKTFTDFINGNLRPAVQWLMSKLGLSTDLQKENTKKQEEATVAANTHAEAIGGATEELEKNNDEVKDNTQHWKNWISTLRAAYSSRFPSAAKSFLTMFGSGGSLNPTTGQIGAVPVNINLNTPDGTMSLPAQMTPQQLAQANRSGRQFSGSLSRMTRGVNLNPAMRNGPAFQN